MAKSKEIFRGKLAACTRVEQFTRFNGEPGVKCVFHIVCADGRERAVTATNDLTNWAGCIGADVEVELVNRVFNCHHNGMDWLGNDMYALNIKSI